ncbi:MAG TPA: hypothetical protein VE990_03010 [Acidimicrobiales bacterium]|nr:hypothetical protein [Acidimicrobiales bacterium]
MQSDSEATPVSVVVAGMGPEQAEAWLSELGRRCAGLAGVILAEGVEPVPGGVQLRWAPPCGGLLSTPPGGPSGEQAPVGTGPALGIGRAPLLTDGERASLDRLLRSLHARGVVHGNLAPDSVGFDSDGPVLLMVGLADLARHGGLPDRSPSELARAAADDLARLGALSSLPLRRRSGVNRLGPAAAGAAAVALVAATMVLGWHRLGHEHQRDAVAAGGRAPAVAPSPPGTARPGQRSAGACGSLQLRLGAPSLRGGLVVLTSGGSGCSRALAWDGSDLVSLGPDGDLTGWAPSPAGATVVLGDWSCSGKLLPGVLRPDGTLLELPVWPRSGSPPPVPHPVPLVRRGDMVWLPAARGCSG